MKIKPEYKLRKVGGMNVVVSTAGMDFQGIITVNDTAEFIWKMLETGTDRSAATASLAKECNKQENEISGDVGEFFDTLERAGIIE